MIKKLSIIFAVVVICGSFYVAKNINIWARDFIKKQICQALEIKNVTLKHVAIPLRGPIILTGLEIKKNNAYEIKVSDIVLDRGIWGLINGSTGKIYVKSFLINQLSLSDVPMTFWWHKQDLVIHVLDGNILKGKIKGHVILQLLKTPKYQADIQLVDLSLPKFINDFKLQQKLSLSGKVSGRIAVNGSGKTFSVIKGHLGNVQQGGELIIEDTQFLKNMVKSMKLDKVAGSEDYFLASLKHYLYNKLEATLNLQKGDLMLEAVLEGQSGKRVFPIVYHDFNLERLGL